MMVIKFNFLLSRGQNHVLKSYMLGHADQHTYKYIIAPQSNYYYYYEYYISSEIISNYISM